MSVFGQLRDEFGFHQHCSPNYEAIITSKIRLVGTIFNGSTFDTNFWTKGTAVNGTVAQTGSEMIVTSGPTAADYAGFYSVRKANWIAGTSNQFRSQVRFTEAADANLVRRWGIGAASAMTSTAITDGVCFKLTGTALSICTYANNVVAVIDRPSSEFNGSYTAPTWTNNNTFEILYTLGKIYFIINGVIVHTETFSTTHWTYNTTSFHVFADANTLAGGSTAKTMTFRTIHICRIGAETTNPQHSHITTAADVVLKYGGGKLHQIAFNDTKTGTTVSIYDNVSGTGNPIAVVANISTTAAPCNIDYALPFQNGLHIVTTGTWDITIVYE